LPGLVPVCLAIIFAAIAFAQTADLAPVVSKPVSRTIDLPAELLPFLTVSLHAKLPSYVERVLVDRGSVVKQGDLLVALNAPELKTQIVEAESQVQAADSGRRQAEAQLAAVQSTRDRLKKAAETPGAVAGNELDLAEKQVDAMQELVRSRRQAAAAAQSVVEARKELEAYLTITAPFDGVVTDRFVHPGALAGPGADTALLLIQQVAHLRLVVPVPEEDVGGVAQGASVPFRVPAYPERKYAGTVARIARALDPKTRTMPVELDVFNRDGSLAPGMYPTVSWPVRRTNPALFVPRTSVVTTTERTFVIRNQNGRAEWVDVKKGAADGELIEVIGNLHPGDMVVRRATDEIRDGTPLQSTSGKR
jgi:RND family efflux transporter MFP subunit